MLLQKVLKGLGQVPPIEMPQSSRLNAREKELVAVWGTTGFIGGQISQSLLRHGWYVRGLGRRPFTALEDQSNSYETRLIDFDASIKTVSSALSGAACAIHCAGHYEAGDVELASYLNSVRHCAMAARELGLNRLVLVSSISVYGASDQDFVDLQTPPQPETSYARSRWLAEQVAATELAGSRTGLSVIRVPSVVGVEMRSDVLRRFFSALRFGLFVHPGRIDAVFHCVGIHRLAEFVSHVVAPKNETAPALLQIVDSIRWLDLAERYGQQTGSKLLRVGVPPDAVRLVFKGLGLSMPRAVRALDSTIRYQDNVSLLPAANMLPSSMEDVDALIASLRKESKPS